MPGKHKIFTAVLLFCATSAFAAESGQLDASGLKSTAGAQRRPPVATATRDVTPSQTTSPLALGMDLTLKVPFSLLNRKLSAMDNPQVKVIDPVQPVLSGDTTGLQIRNLLVTINGIGLKPVITLKPWLDGQNRLAIKITGVKVSLSMSPDKAIGSLPVLDKNSVMEMVMRNIMALMQDELDASFAAGKMPLKATDMLSFTYDRETWTQRIILDPSCGAKLLPGFIQTVTLSAFSFDGTAFYLKLHS